MHTLDNTLPPHNNISTKACTWAETIQSYQNAWASFLQPHATNHPEKAWIALGVASQAYAGQLKMRKPRAGDVENLGLLLSHVEQNAKIDPETKLAHEHLKSFKKMYTNCVLQYAKSVIEDACSCKVGPLSFSGALDDLAQIKKATTLMDIYHKIKDHQNKRLDYRGLAKKMQRIGAAHQGGFSDYDSGEFSTTFEALSIHLGMLHLEAIAAKKPQGSKLGH